MAEEVTLAELSIDSSGVVSGVDEASDALDKGEDRLDQFSKAGEGAGGSMDSLAGSVVVVGAGMTKFLARSLGVIGVAAALGFGIRKLAKDVLASADVWQRFKARVDDVYRSFAAGETLVGRVSRKTVAAAKAVGIETNFAVAEQLKQLTEFRKLLEEQTLAGDESTFGPLQNAIDATNRKMQELEDSLIDAGLSLKEIIDLGKENPNLFERLLQAGLQSLPFDILSKLPPGLLAEAGQASIPKGSAIEPADRSVPPLDTTLFEVASLMPPEEVAREMVRVAQAVRLLNEEFAETGNLGRWAEGIGNLEESMERLHATAAEFIAAGLAAPDNRDFLFDQLGVPSPEEIEERMAGIEFALADLGKGFADPLDQTSVSIEFFDIAVRNLHQSLVDLKVPAAEIARLFESYDVRLLDAGISTDIFSGQMDALVDQMSEGAGVFEFFMTTVSAFVDAFSNVLTNENTNLKEQLGEMLKTIGQAAISLAILFAAAAIAAATGYGSTVLGGTAEQFATAAAAFFAVGVALGAAGNRLSSEGSGDGGESGDGGRGFGDRRSVVNVNIDGSLIGTNPDELARSISRLINKNQEDGAR